MISKLSVFFNAIGRALTSEYVVDALRNTIAVSLPLILFFYLQKPALAIGIGTGALLICLTDLPGNRGNKFKTAWISVAIFGITASVTALSMANQALMISVLVSLTFLLTMLGALGQRLSMVGLMAIALAIFTIGLKPSTPLAYGFYVLIGGIWYYLISLIQIYWFPYRSVIRSLNQTVRQTAALLVLRSKGYDPNYSLAGFNEKNMRLQLKIANQHEMIRQLLLSDTKAMDVASGKGALLLNTALNLIDLYEQVSAIHYDYPYLRNQLADTGMLPLIQNTIELLAKQLQSSKLKKSDQEQLVVLMAELTHGLQQASSAKAQLLKQIVLNLIEIKELISGATIGKAANLTIESSMLKYREFLSATPLNFMALIRHFSLQSPIFRFALRLSILCLVALTLITFFSTSHYSYWLLLTVIIVSRPSYGLTLKRNWERLGGTFLGILSGYLLMNAINTPLQLTFSAIFLFGFFVFNRLAYGASVVCITIAVLLCLNVYDGHPMAIISERLAFTLLGGLLCLGATFLFPIWSAPRIYDSIQMVLRTNAAYFETVIRINPTNADSMHQSRLARKNSHLQLTALSEAVNAAEREPFGKQLNWSLIRRIELLCHQFNALTAALASAKKQNTDVLTAVQIAKIQADIAWSLHHATPIDLSKEVSFLTTTDQPLDLIVLADRIKQILLQITIAH